MAAADSKNAEGVGREPGGWHTPLSDLTGIGPKRLAALAQRGVYTIADLWFHLPRRYIDFSGAQAAPPQPGQHGVFRARVRTVSCRRTRHRRLGVTRARLVSADGTPVTAVWFHGIWGKPEPVVRTGEWLLIAGVSETEFLKDGAPRHFVNPARYTLTSASDEGPGLVPVYTGSGAIGPNLVKRLVAASLEYLTPQCEYLPSQLRHELDLPSLQQTLHFLHQPPNRNVLDQALKRLTFDDLFFLALGLTRRSVERRSRGPFPARVDFLEKLNARWASVDLPFTPTAAQMRAISDIATDLANTRLMTRVVQGDVGSGKSLVALYFLLAMVEMGGQVVLAAPTQLLAEQHRARIGEQLNRLGVPWVYVTGDLPPSARREALRQCSEGSARVAIGTQALATDTVQFAALAGVAVDELHRFGVRQVDALLEKGRPAWEPHLLGLTATPIPRTIASILHGGMSVSILDELPPGRLPVDTRCIHPSRRAEVYGFVKRAVERGGQAYVVFPLVHGDDDGLCSHLAAEDQVEALAAGPLQGLRLGLVHGKMSRRQQARVLEAFASGDLQVLCATAVVEVGLDVPAANVMVIEGADRFGLAQLHQLRGRIGRGTRQSYCLVISDAATPAARERLELFRREQCGFALAEADLAMRGPGEFLGTRQSGMPELQVADLFSAQSAALLDEAKVWAERLVAMDPHLRRPEHQALKAAYTRWERRHCGS